MFTMLGSLMFCSKVSMEILPNIHLLGMFTVVFTVVFRAKALIPVYVYVLVNGLYAGFSMWWMPYLYIWTILWGITMLLPKRMPRAVACVVYAAVCTLHGLFFGVLYAPAQALMFGWGWDRMLTWVLTGLTFDILHALGNLAAGLLILPFCDLTRRLCGNVIPHH